MDSILREKLSKSVVAIKKWLNDGEKVDYDKSQYFEDYLIIRVTENGEFKIGWDNFRKGRFIFAKETQEGIKYLYDSPQLYKDWNAGKKDFSKLSALDTNIYLHLVVSLVDDPVSALSGAVMIDVPTIIHKYLLLHSDAKGDKCKRMMQKCAGFFFYPYFCYLNFYFAYESLNMAREAGIAHEMMGRSSDLNLGENKTKLEENRIYIGFGLMLKGKFKEAIDIFSKQYDLCIKKFNEEKGKKSRLAYSLTTLYSDILIAEGYLLWATGTVLWTKEKRKNAEKSFRDSYDALSRAYSNHKNEPMPFLVEHLLTELRKGSKVLGMDEQLKFMNEWSEKCRKEIESEKETKTEKRAGLTEEVLEKVTSIDSKIAKFVELKARGQSIVPKEKTKKKEPEEEKAEYEKLSDLEKSELEVGYINDEYIVKIDGGTIEEFKTSENDFARFLRLSVAMAVNERNWEGRIYKYDEPDIEPKSRNFNLYIGGLRQESGKDREAQDKQKKRDTELYDLRNFLGNCESLRLKRIEKRNLIWSKKQYKQVRLGVKFKKIKIINVENLKNFKSKLSKSVVNKFGTLIADINEVLIRDAYNAYKEFTSKNP